MGTEERAVKYLVKDADGKGHLPYTKDDGKPDHRLMGAAWAALHGGYRGNKYSGPGKAEAIAKLERLYKSEGMTVPTKRDLQEGECRFVNDQDFRGEFRAEADGKTITGYPAKFNRKSRNLGGFRENIKPGAFERTLADKDDIRALINHDPNLLLGRTKAGTLRLKEDGTGLRMENDAPDTGYCRDLIESMKRGDIDQGSFRFLCRSDNWRMEDGEAVRDLLDVQLRDASIVTFPAYEDTTATVRSVSAVSAIAGIDLSRLASVLVRVEHELDVNSEDRSFLAESIDDLKRMEVELGDPSGAAASARRRLQLAEAELGVS